MSYVPSLVANSILERAHKEGVPLTPMKLQKIMYFVASEYAKQAGEPLLTERFATWDYGPVLPTIYQEFRAYSKRPIEGYALDAQGTPYAVDEEKDPNFARALRRVWAVTRDMTAVALSRITHREGSAWWLAYQADEKRLDNDAVQRDETYRMPLFGGV